MMDKFKDECGVFGIFNHEEAGRMAYLGLYALQHRGQESAGIVSTDGERVYKFRRRGLVSENFTKGTFDHLKGRMAIGHVRYSTSGGDLQRNVQPFLGSGSF